MVKYAISVFKNYFWYFKAGKHSLPLSTQVDIVYVLTAVYNFININNPNNLNYVLKVQNKIIDKEDAKLIKVKSDIVINQKRDKITKLI